ncbi:MAG: calcium-binding protein, partial [Gammaproteobacteria bacterium]|nr:calcium-binding protein [Gammaproteobacteria bacterium]
MSVSVISDGLEDGIMTISGPIASNGSIEIRTRDQGNARTVVRENGSIVFQQNPRPNTIDASAVTATPNGGFQVTIIVDDAFSDEMTLIGSPTLRNNITGGFGNDIITDTNAGIGDTFNGGAGVDTLIADITWNPGVLYNLALGWMRFPGAGGTTYDTISNIENLTVGGGAEVIGDANDNVITILDTGVSSNNTINAGAGNDTVNSGIGDDIIEGGAGDDTLDGGADTDTLSYAGAGT